MNASSGAILVFGAGGQVGHELMSRAHPGTSVIGLTHADADICDANVVSTVVGHYGPVAIVNAAAYTAVDKAESEVARAFEVNETGCRNLARAATLNNAVLIHLSTDYVFDGSKREPYVEDDPTKPLNAYGRSKEAGERVVRAECPRHIVLRTAWVYSAHGANFVKTMLQLAAERDVVRVVDDQRGTPTSASDISQAIYSIIAKLGDGTAGFGTFHLTNSGYTTWHGFAARIFDAVAARGGRVPRLEAITTSDYPTPAIRPKNSMLNCNRVREAYGIVLRPWESALDDVLSALHGGPATGNPARA
jgi:dTDP-4-dehydrorhamnose reductase